MSKQVAIRLPDDLAAFVEGEIADGRAASRATVISRALERERRYRRAMADVAILQQDSPSEDLDDLAAYAAELPSDLD